MVVLSLFDGISCGQLALTNLGYKIDKYYASEIDKNAIKITNKNFPNTIQIGDIEKITIEDIKKIDKIDLILGGSPCQGFRRAGLGLNFEDPRSKLFFKFVEVLEWVRKFNNQDVKFLLENVKMKKEWEEVISKHLNIEAIEINSKLLTAQNRSRLYWTNIKGIKGPKDKGIKLIDILDNVELENYIVKDCLKICKSISDNSVNLINVINGEVRINQATKQGYIVANEGDGINLSFPLSKNRRGRVIKEKSSCLDTQCDICVYVNNAIRRFTINELEKLQGLPIGYTLCDEVSERNRMKAIGNGWTIDVIEYILGFMKISSINTEIVVDKYNNEQLRFCI